MPVSDTLQNYKKSTQCLGRGSFGNVYLATCLRRNKYVALKEIKLKTLKDDQKKCVLREIDIHHRLNHEHILQLYSSFQEDGIVYLVLELCPEGDLQSYVQRKGGHLTEDEARAFMVQIVNGVAYLHSQNIIHRDLKLQNILLTEDLKVKISDFSLATQVLHHEDKQMTMCGTPNFMSPEIAEDVGHSFEVDIWGLGCILYNLLVGKPPFNSETVKRTLARVKQVDYVIPKSLSENAKHLINCLLRKDPETRIKLTEVLVHPFMRCHDAASELARNRAQSFTDSGVGSMSAATSSNITANMCQESELHKSEAIVSQQRGGLPRLFQCGSVDNITKLPLQSQFTCGSLRQSNSLQDVHSDHYRVPNVHSDVNRYHAIHPMCNLAPKPQCMKSQCPECGNDGSQCCLQKQQCSITSTHSSNLCSRRDVAGLCMGHSDTTVHPPATMCSHTRHTFDHSFSCCSHIISCSCRTRAPSSHSRDATQGQPIQPAKHGSSLRSKTTHQKPPPLNCMRLKPKTHCTKNVMLRIMEDGEVCIEFFRPKDQVVKDVCRISRDGKQIVIYQPASKTVLSSFPAAQPERGTSFYTYDNLPQCHWKKYIYASRFVDLVKAKTPKVIFYSEKATCILTENGSFEACFHDGGNITQSSSNIKIIDPGGNSYSVDAAWTAENVSREVQIMWDHFKKCHNHCCNIESALKKLEGSTDLTLFPITVGKCRKGFSAKMPMGTPDENNKENKNAMLQRHLGVDATSSEALSPISAYSGGSAAFSSQANLSGSLQQQQHRPILQDVTSRQNHSDPKAKLAQMQSKKRAVIKQAQDEKIGHIYQFDNGDVEISFTDRSKLCFTNKLKSFDFDRFEFSNPWNNKSRIYRHDENLPPNVQEKLRDAALLISRLHQSSITGSTCGQQGGSLLHLR